MTTKEFRAKISESKLPQKFNEVTLTINYTHLELRLDFVGLSSIHEFFSKQVQGWDELASSPNEIQNSKNFFTQSLNQLEQFLNSNVSTEDENHLANQWRQTASRCSGNDNYFTFDSPKTTFLLSVHEKDQRLFRGAYEYIIGRYQSNSRHDFLGTMLAYEFESKGEIEIAKRVAAEKKQIKQLRSEFQNQINQSETQLVDHLAESNQKFEEYSGKIDQLKEDKESLFDQWFRTSQEGFNTFDADAKSKLAELERVYGEKLKLEKPARYWQNKSTGYLSHGNKARTLLIWIVSLACVLLSLILIISPDYIFNAVFDGNEMAIVRWSIVFITLLSLIAYAIRAVSKYMFSSYHLARDAEERHALTFFYLALLKDTDVKDEDRKLILQSLFSRAETGLLKDESGPTMPTESAGRFFTGR